MTPVLAALRDEHPEITVELVVANSFFTLTERDADVALRPAVVAPEALVGRRLAALATAPYASPSYLADRRGNLADHDWLGFEESLGHLLSVRWLSAHVPSERIVQRANSLVALREAAVSAWRRCPATSAIPIPRSGASRRRSPLRLLVHPSLRRVARVRVVPDAIAAGLARQRPLVEGREAKRPGAPGAGR